MDRNYVDEAINILNKYGNAKRIETKNSKLNAIIFICDISKVIEDEFLEAKDSITLILGLKNNGSASLYCFGLGKKEQIGENALDIINKVNGETTFGKFIIDDDDELYWEMLFDMNRIEDGDIKGFLISFLTGIKKISMMIGNAKDEK